MHSGNQNGAPATAGPPVAPGASDRRWAWMLAIPAIVLLVAVAMTHVEIVGQHWMTRILMQREDVPVLLPLCALLLVLAWHQSVRAAASSSTSRTAIGSVPHLPRFSTATATMVLVGGAALAVLAGTHVIALDFAYSRDEAMVVFDTAVIAKGRLIAPVAAEWRAFVPALQPEFRLEVPGNVAWISSYLPGNAVIRAVLGAPFGTAVGAAVANAVLVAVALIAIYGIAKRLWPERPDAAVIAVMVMATSSQVLFMGMTPYAMSAHLALNLVWLWLFLRNDPGSHIAAVLVGFLAVGLHQIVFHPLFVAPFLLQLLVQRRLMPLAFYVVCYLAIGLFWVGYWQWLLAVSGVDAASAGQAGLPFLMARVQALLADFNLAGFETLVQNLMRFAAWQNPLMLVLGGAGLVFALRAPWRGTGDASAVSIMGPLAMGIYLTLAVMFILLPYQGSGWGYRYLHGLIGSLALLAAFAWVRVAGEDGGADRATAWRLASITTAVAVLILMPVHAMQMRATHSPYAGAVAAIEQSSAAAVVIDTPTIVYGNDLVRNHPDLTNRPLVFDFGLLNEDLITILCSRFGKVAVFTGSDAARFGIDQSDTSKHPELARYQRQWAVMEALSCRVPIADMARLR